MVRYLDLISYFLIFVKQLLLIDCYICRFHVLSEFDEGKRSCRRRLAGHNRRRRKAQPDDVAPQVLSSGGNENVANTGLDLVGLLAAITNAQGITNILWLP